VTAPGATATVAVIDGEDGAASLASAWDELAVERALPLCAPGWMLPWWRHVAPAGSEMRIVAAHAGSQLVALAPWFVQRGRRVDVRFLGAEISDRVDILCLPGHEPEVADLLRRAIRHMQPRPDLLAFEAVPAGSAWSRRLTTGPGGRALFAPYRNSVIAAPTVSLTAAGAEPGSWLDSRSSNFRGQMRRMRRRLESRGGRVRQIVDPGEVGRALDALLSLHAARWEGRAPSQLLSGGIRELLHEAAGELGPDRLRLWAAEVGDELISVQLFLAAGGEIKYWNGGWMEEHADLKPTMLTILAALEDGIARGERRLDLGAGTHPYKMRFADGSDALTWGGLIVRNARWPRTRAELAPLVARHRAKQLVQRMPSAVSGRIEALARRRREATPD
jgi:CelD/BcsL family acetyltransferase involved in cellulose biosynthesis